MYDESAKLLREELEHASKLNGRDASEVAESAESLHELLVEAGHEAEATKLADEYGVGKGDGADDDYISADALDAVLVDAGSKAEKMDWGRDEFNA